MAADELDKDLAKALQVAKKKPRNFAIIAKGQNVLKVLVDKKPIKEGSLIKAKKEVQGNAIVTGVVQGDGPDLVFQVTEETTLAEPKLKKFLSDTTGLTLKPRFQVVAALQEVNDDAADEEPTSDAADSAALEAKLAASLKNFAPLLQKAMTLHPDRKPELLAAFSKVRDEFSKKQFSEAQTDALSLGKLLQSLISAGPSGGQAADAQSPKEGSSVVLTRARLQWDAARKTVAGELERLEESIITTFKDHPRIPKERLADLDKRAKKLYTILDKLDQRLIDKLDEALNATTPENRAALNNQAAKIVSEYQAFVDSDALINSIDDNPFTRVNVRSHMVRTLSELSSQLA